MNLLPGRRCSDPLAPIALLTLGLALLWAPAAPAAEPAPQPAAAPEPAAPADDAEEEEEDDWGELDEEEEEEAPVDGPATLQRLLSEIDALEGQPWMSSADAAAYLQSLPGHVRERVLETIVSRRIVHPQQLATIFTLELPADAIELVLSDGCVLCHTDPDSQFDRTLFLLDPAALDRPSHLNLREYVGDAHFRSGLGCAGCHGGSPDLRDHIPEMRDRWPRGGDERRADRSWIPAFCGDCHADTQRMRGFNPALPTDQLAKYRESMHGSLLLGEGDSKAAQCLSCHGVHGIRGADSRLSHVHATRLPETCGACHSDADYMAGYQADDGRPLPTNQVELFRQSVHGRALLERGDTGAPSCNDCHGNHAARPPEVANVSQVCRTCHLSQGQLFDGSRHKKAFDEQGWPECAKCHHHHDIGPATDELLSTEPGGLCHDCHVEFAGDRPECTEGALHFRDTLALYATHEREFEPRVERVAHRGMDPDGLTGALSDLREALIQTRTAVHSFEVSTFDQAADGARAAVERADQLGAAADAEYRFRQRGVLVSIGIMILLALGLYLKLRRLEASQRRAVGSDDGDGLPRPPGDVA